MEFFYNFFVKQSKPTTNITAILLFDNNKPRPIKIKKFFQRVQDRFSLTKYSI